MIVIALVPRWAGDQGGGAEADPGIAAAGGRLIGSLGSILAVLGRGTGPRGEKMAGRSLGTDSQDLATTLDPLGPFSLI